MPAEGPPTGARGRSGRCCGVRGWRPGARQPRGVALAPRLLHVGRRPGGGREGGRAGARHDRAPRPGGRAPARPGRASGPGGARRCGSPARGCRRRRRPRSEGCRAECVSSSPRRIVLRAITTTLRNKDGSRNRGTGWPEGSPMLTRCGTASPRPSSWPASPDPTQGAARERANVTSQAARAGFGRNWTSTRPRCAKSLRT